MHIPTIGRIVHYRFPSAEGLGERPAIIVRVWSPGDVESSVQLQVFMDTDEKGNHNDGREIPLVGPTRWQTSVTQGHEPGEFHFYEECPDLL